MSEIIEQITRRFEQDEQRKPKAYTADQVPATYEAITPQWLTAVLCGATPGAEVVAHELGPVDDGSSNRRRIRLTYNEAGQHTGLPASVFCKAAHALLNRIMLCVSNSTRNEINFYCSVRPQLQLTAPTAYFANFDPESWAAIALLEDYTERATFCDERTQMDAQRVRHQLDWLAKLHGQSYQRPELFTVGLGVLTWSALWKLYVQLGNKEFCDKGFVTAAERGLVPDRLYKRRAEVWPRTMDCVERHDSLPRMITHNDVHLKNWFVMKDGQMGVGDWQTMAIGHWSRDVAYCISSALTTENRRVSEKELLGYYLEKLREQGGPTVSFAEAWSLYRQQMFTALAFWTLTLTPSEQQPDMQPVHTTEVFLKRIATAVDDLDSLDSFA